MRRLMLAVTFGLATVLTVGCDDGKGHGEKSLEEQAQERDARESADPSLRAVRNCTADVVGQIVYRWREYVGSDMASTGTEEARRFTTTYLPGSPEHNSFIQHWGDGMAALNQAIALEGENRDDAILEQTALASEAVKQDCEVAYGQ